MSSPSPNSRGRSPGASRSPHQLRTLSDDELAAVIERLKVLARQARASRIPYLNDASQHYRVFGRAIINVLSTELALFTFAQIVDGLPTADVAWDCRAPDLGGAHPIEQHEDICPGVLERTRGFRKDFNLDVLSFDPKVLYPTQFLLRNQRS